MDAYLFSALLTRNGITSELAILCGVTELSAPNANDVLQSLKENSFDLLVQLGQPSGQDLHGLQA
jgi:hypothetical protein